MSSALRLHQSRFSCRGQWPTWKPPTDQSTERICEVLSHRKDTCVLPDPTASEA